MLIDCADRPRCRWQAEDHVEVKHQQNNEFWRRR